MRQAGEQAHDEGHPGESAQPPGTTSWTVRTAPTADRETTAATRAGRAKGPPRGLRAARSAPPAPARGGTATVMLTPSLPAVLHHRVSLTLPPCAHPRPQHRGCPGDRAGLPPALGAPRGGRARVPRAGRQFQTVVDRTRRVTIRGRAGRSRTRQGPRPSPPTGTGSPLASATGRTAGDAAPDVPGWSSRPPGRRGIGRGATSSAGRGLGAHQAGLVGDDDELGAVAGVELHQQGLTWVLAVAGADDEPRRRSRRSTGRWRPGSAPRARVRSGRRARARPPGVGPARRTPRSGGG